MLWLRRSFIAGFFVTVPLFVSVAAFIWIFNVVDSATTPLFLIAAVLEPTGMVVVFDEFGRGGDWRGRPYRPFWTE